MSDVKKENHIQGVGAEQIKKKDYKLLVDPQIRRGEEKLFRYEGVAYNTENHGQGVVVLRDPRPRMNRLWSRRERCELPVPRYKVDEWYIGAVPPREVTFSRLNDNITKQFMEKMCIKFGKLERVRVYHHPKTQKHMGLSKVVFSSIKSASECVKKLHQTSVMGNVIHAQIDCKGEILNKLFQRIVRGEMMAETIPDVIRHTQDGITMSIKYKEQHHHHHGKKERRKSSQDDPRKLRRSVDEKIKPNSHRSSDDIDVSEHSKDHTDQMEYNTQKSSQLTHKQLEKKSSVDTPVQRKESSEHTDHETEHTTDSEEVKSGGQRVWSSDLESRISSLLYEQTKKYNLDEVPPNNSTKPSKSKDDDQSSHSSRRKDKKLSKKSKRSKKHSIDSYDSNTMDSPHHAPLERARSSERSSTKREKNRKNSVPNSPLPNTFSRHSPPPRDFVSPPRDFDQGSGTSRELPYPHHDRDIISHDRRDSRSRSPGRNTQFFNPPPPHRFYDERDRFTPPLYHNRHPVSPRHSPRFGQDHRIPDRERFDRDFERFEMFRGEDRDFHRRDDFPYRRRDMSPPPRGMPSPPRRHRGHSPGARHSPGRWLPPDRFSNHIPPHRRHSPPPHRDFYPNPSRDRSPRPFRRTPSPERRRFRTPDDMRQRREPIHERRRRSRSPSPRRRQRTRSGEERVKPRGKSSDASSPKLSLDQRLQQMTGEKVKSESIENHLVKPKEIDKDNEKSEDDDSNCEHNSVDMEISEGESESEKANRDQESLNAKQQLQQQEVNNFQLPTGHLPNQEQWNFNKEMPWSSFDPSISMPQHMDTRMWNPMQQNFFKGFQQDPRFPPPFPSGSQFPQNRWPDAFHPAMRHAGMSHPFNVRPNVPQTHLGSNEEPRPGMSNDEIQRRFEDYQLSKHVLDDVVQDLKAIVSRDLNRKVIETMAFKVYEAWWDENENTIVKKPAIPKVSSSSALTDKNTANENNVTVDESNKENKTAASNAGNRSLLNTFDPLNWAKNSFEMDGFRVGLGLRSAISKMPSFRVKKRPRTPTPPRENLEDSEVAVNKKSRKLQDKENQEQPRRRSKDKKYHRIALDSEGEDEEEEEENLSEEEESADSEAGEKEKYTVLDVDEIFSESSESSDESDSDIESEKAAETSDESESENEALSKEKKEISNSKPIIPDIDVETVDEDNKEKEKDRESEEENKNEKMDTDENSRPSILDGKPPIPKPIEKLQLPSEDPNLAASLLSPTAHGISPNSAITPQQLRHVHPKKRHRLWSQEAFSKIPDNKLTTDDEFLSASNKEKTLMDTQLTPERKLSTYSDSSPAPGTPKTPTTPQKLFPTTRKLDDKQSDSSPQKDLEAVAKTLLSIGKTIPPISPTPDSTSQPITPENRKSTLNSSTGEDKARMAELAEEHNYFVPSYGPASPHPTLDPMVSQILEEHCYSRPESEQISLDVDRVKGISSPLSVSTLSVSSVYNFDDESSEVISAAERVKLRRVKPKDKKRGQKEKRSVQRPVVQFSPRSEVDEMMILYEMWYNGLDLEDMKYLRTVYEGYLEKSNSPAWVNDSHWVAHPITNIPTVSSSKRRKSKRKSRSDKSTIEEEDEWHKTGCARTEGYYKLKDLIKLRQRQEMYGKGNTRTPAQSTKQTSSNKVSELTSGAQSCLDKNPGSRETRHFMRRIASEVGADVGDLFKYNQLMFRKKAVKFKRSSIHGWGLFAQEAIGADEMVIEYVGQVVRTLVAERREVNYTELGIGSSYLFRIDSEHIIDATKCGNYARFMNHSCNPSCYAKVITVDTAKKIVIYSKGPIKESQEITYDYKFPLEDDKIMCFCGAENCRRTLN
ncbi:uncharacterized protein LOC120333780 [Styela clava]